MARRHMALAFLAHAGVDPPLESRVFSHATYLRNARLAASQRYRHAVGDRSIWHPEVGHPLLQTASDRSITDGVRSIDQDALFMKLPSLAPSRACPRRAV